MTTLAVSEDEAHWGESSAGVSRPVIVLAVTGTILLALGAFWLSFTTLQDLAILSGIPAGQAWVWPLIVDGVILEATISVVALRNSAPAARRFAWLLLAAGAGVSVAANVTHAVIGSDTRVPALIADVVASVPPLVLLAMTHLTVELTRNASPSPATTAPRSQTAALERRGNASDQRNPAVDTASEAEATVDVDAVEVLAPTPGRPQATPPAPRAGQPRAIAAVRGRSAGRREAARARAVERYAQGVPLRQIAAEEGVHPTTVGRWVNVPEPRQDGAPHD